MIYKAYAGLHYGIHRRYFSYTCEAYVKTEDEAIELMEKLYDMVERHMIENVHRDWWIWNPPISVGHEEVPEKPKEVDMYDVKCYLEEI